MNEEMISIEEPMCSGKKGELSSDELKVLRASITSALRYIKSYNGPSRIWFAYQDSLSEGCRRLSPIVTNLPVSKQTADLLVDLLIRIDRKIQNGVDDSDGTVGSFAYVLSNVLKEFVIIDPTCIETFKKLCQANMGFGFEDELVKIFDEGLT